MMNFEVFPSPEELLTCQKNVKCTQEGCSSSFAHSGALYMHLIKSHRVVKTLQDRTLYSSVKGKKCNDGCLFQYYCPQDRCIYRKGSNRYFTTFKLLKQHYQKVHAEKIYRCEKCPAAFSLERELRRHVGHCGVMFKCGSCPVMYTTKETLQSHCRRKEHTFPEEYASANSNKQKSRNSKTVAENSPQQKTVPVAVLILGLPGPAQNQPTLPKALLPKDIESTIQGIKIAQAQSTKLPSTESAVPVKQHAVIQTEIYGVENLAIEGRGNQSENSEGVNMIPEKSIARTPHKVTKSKLKNDKENPLATRNKKSSTGMQTSVSLFKRKRLKTVTGTQTSGDYILKKAMASADIPIQRKTVASQVTPQKQNTNLKRRAVTCSSETQTGVSPEKQVKVDSNENAFKINIGNMIDTTDQVLTSDGLDEQQMETLGDSLSTSTQTLQSYLENLNNESKPDGNVLPLSPKESYAISQNSCQAENSDISNNEHTSQPSLENARVLRNIQEESAKVLKNVSLEDHNLKDSNMVLQCRINGDGKMDSDSLDMRSGSQIKHNFPVAVETNTLSKGLLTPVKTSKPAVKMIPRNTSGKGTTPNILKKSENHKGRKTIRNLLDNNAHKSSLGSSKPLISTTSGILFSNNILTYSVAKSAQSEDINQTSIVGQPKLVINEGETDYDSHKLFSPVKDEMFSGKTNDTGSTIDMEAQTMSAIEFEKLLLASGLFLGTSGLQNQITGVNSGEAGTVFSACGKANSQIATNFVHKEMETEMLTDTDFDFLTESSATIDMNTQTITDFGNLLGESYGPMDSDTQTVADIDFLDLVTTNMETQTLSDRDLIDLGLMDPQQVSVKPLNNEIDDLKSSETQTGLNAKKSGDADKSTSSSCNSEVNIYDSTGISDKPTGAILRQTLNTTLNEGDLQNKNLTDSVKEKNGKLSEDSEKKLNTSERTTESQLQQNNQSDDFQTTNMETQTAFDDLEKMLLE